VKFQSSHDWRKILSDVQETRLDNGLTGLVLPCPGIATVVSDIYYAGGSASDPQGRFGLSHFLEHMLFNGTTRVPRGMLDRIILRLAGQHNAETGPDFTHFWCQVPSHALELALALEADRMTGALLDDDDLQRERTIIIEEEARYREQPFDELMMRLISEIYAGHPYAHPTIGTSDDLKAIETSDLRAHYQRTFQPANAVVVLAGDFRPGHAIEQIEKRFGPLPSSSNERICKSLGPPSTAAFDGRRIAVDSSEVVPRGALLWPAPGPFDLSARAWGVATAILGGGRSSRLWQSLVDEQQLAAYVSVSLSEERLGGYLMIDLELNPEAEPEAVEGLIFDLLDELAQHGPTPAEVRRAAVQRSAAARWARQQSSTLASALGTWSLFADWRTLGEAWQRDDIVTAEDVQAVAATLRRTNVVRGWTVPVKPKKSQRPSEPGKILKPQKTNTSVPPEAPREIELDAPLQLLFNKADRTGLCFKPRCKPLLHEELGGMTVVTETLRDASVSCVELRWRSGWLEEAVPGLASVTARVCEELTDRETGKSFVELFEELGASLEAGSTGFSVQGLGEDLGRTLKLLQRMIWSPKWSAETLKRVAQRTRTELRADLDDPSFQAELLWRRLVFAGQPGQEDSRGTLESLKQMNLTAVRSHHARFYQPANAILGVAGSQRRDRLSSMVQRHFLPQADMATALAGATPDWAELLHRPLPAAQQLNMRSPGTQTHLVLGHRTLPRTHPDWVAMQALEVILGSGPGLTDLLTRRLRDELGLVYAVSLATAEGAWRSPGALRVGFSCDPADARQAEAETIQILRQAARGELTDEDCNEARDYLARSWPVAYEAADDRLACWLDTELEGWDLSLPPAWVRTCTKLTPKLIRDAARRWIRPDLLQIVRFGP